MASKVPSGNGIAAETPKTEAESEIHATAAIETERKVEEETSPAKEAEPAADHSTALAEKKWPGWPGDCVFRLIVPVLKVGSIIGRKGDLIKKMCEETKARIRVLEGPVGNPDRIVLISGKEEKEAPLSPAMDAVIRVFKRVNGFPENEDDGVASVPFCSIRLLVPSMQAMSLIGKQGSSIKTIQETSGCSVRVVSSDEVSTLYANSDDKVVDLQGEAVKVLKALEAVVGHLRKFLVDHSVLPLFEKTHNATATQERQVEPWAETSMLHTSSHPRVGGDYPLPMKRESLFANREPQRESQFSSSRLSFYGRDPGLSTTRSPALGGTSGPFVTQVAHTMQIPLVYAEDIIGVGGTNIAYIRRTSGAILTVQESKGLPDEITVEIKGTSSQVQTAQQLIQECVNTHKDPIPSGYGNMDSGLRSSYSQFADSSYPSSYSRHSYGGYGMSDSDPYDSYRM
ncbi:RNA-binding KH domain-containing protein PEPPER-like isoform X2 [Cynara cardunculus var. scolymus]|uniref:RNA-binding KH domain-containing protein PEPPER-like isoform X2 n=1 Tax=Cynara cardunculus var. scolymus TaxID=59895 RepID=UPI000D62D1C1|nr:RNA-binding KH domain-containing protein PEPPER-like isoform X2 [Cynara cardunculus var. scolymus]